MKNTFPSATDRLRGMFLLSAYGDAFGAGHESSSTIYQEPFPERLPEQNLGVTADQWGYWVTENQLPHRPRGVPTDDTAFKLFILHQWFREIYQGTADFSEASFREGLGKLRSSSACPSWAVGPRNDQIDDWEKMYRAANLPEPEESIFFIPGTPIVFGFFLFLETTAFRTHYSPVENYHYFRTITVLDQGYAKSATGFLGAIASKAFFADLSIGFDAWFFQQAHQLVAELIEGGIDSDEISTIRTIIKMMSELGQRYQGYSPREFMIAFEEIVVQPDHPPFMKQPFKSVVFDPFRMLAEMCAAVAYSQGDPFRAIQPLAFSSGDSDTVCSFLGTLMGIGFGEKLLRQNGKLTDDLDAVTDILTQTFEVDLNERVELFLKLQGLQNGSNRAV